MRSAWPRSSAPVERAAGVALAALALYLHGKQLARNEWPSGPPWPGIGILLLAAPALFWPSGGWRNVGVGERALRIILMLACFGLGLAWLTGIQARARGD